MSCSDEVLTTRRFALSACVLALAALAWARPQDAEALLPGKVIERMQQVYAECESYSDVGTVRTQFPSERGQRVDAKRFATAFVRPDRFRFEYVEMKRFGERSQSLRYVIWQRESQVRRTRPLPPAVRSPATVEDALIWEAGVSSGTSLTVPEMLLPTLRTSKSFSSLQLLQRMADERVRGVECFRVKGVDHGSEVSIWVSKDSFLLLRYESESTHDDFDAVTRIEYMPELNVELDDDTLAFDASPF